MRFTPLTSTNALFSSGSTMKYSALISALFINLASLLSSSSCIASEKNSVIADTENQADITLSKVTLEKVLRIAAETHPSIAQRLS